MRKLALPEEVLLQIEQPARYIGNEFNSVVKDKEKVALRGAFLFPDVYEIGMSHLGIQILYDMFNKREDMWCERVYSPWPDLDRVMREQNIPLFGLESQEPVKNEDFLFITLQYEMCYERSAGARPCRNPAACGGAYRRGPDRHRRRPVYVQPGADRSVLRPVLHRRG